MAITDSHLPALYTQVAFNADPFDSTQIPVWQDLSTRQMGIGSATRGRSQYELDQPQTGTFDVTLFDADEALNAANPSGPYAGYITPYRAALVRAVWPPAGTGNWWNLAYQGLDGSFESYTTGTTPTGWAAVGTGAGTPTTVAAGAFQGTKALSFTTAASANSQGAFCSGQTVPGQTYCYSVYVNQSAANTLQLLQGGSNAVLASDDFMPRTVANGWGTAHWAGGAWTTNGGTAAEYAVTGGMGTQSHSATSSRKRCLTQPTTLDSNQRLTVTPPTLATGAGIEYSLQARFIDTNNSYYGALTFLPGGQTQVSIVKRVAGTQTTLTSAILPTFYQAGQAWNMQFIVVENTLMMSAWTGYYPPPNGAQVSVTDTSLTAPGSIGVSTVLNSGNTNTTPVVCQVDTYAATGNQVLTSTTTSGAYVRLSGSFTASATSHYLMLLTTGTTSASTVLVDGVQLELGTTPSTFTTTGPIVRNFSGFPSYVERWPLAWDPDSAGFLGLLAAPVVGAFTRLQASNLHTEFRSQVLSLQPRYYWPLDEAAGTAFGDVSQWNSNPSLQLWNPPGGPATTIQLNSNNAIPGDPQGGSVHLDGEDQATHTYGSNIQTGDVVGQKLTDLGNTQLFAPSALSFSLTAMFVMQTTDTGIGDASGAVFQLFDSQQYGGFNVVLDLVNSRYSVSFGTQAFPVLSFTTASGQAYNGGSPHLFIVTISATSGGNCVSALYVDGAQIGTATISTTSLFGTQIPQPYTQVTIGGPGSYAHGIAPGPTPVNYSHVALWNRALTSTEISNLRSAFTGWPGENPQQRIQRYLTYAGITDLSGIGTGQTTMGTSQLAEGQDALSAILAVQDTEFGYFFEGQNRLVFQGRQTRNKVITATVTFGDRVDLGEYPYEGNVSFDLDPTYIANEAEISRVNGVTAVAQDVPSQRRYGFLQFTRTINNTSDNETQDAANYIVSTHKTPQLRVASISFSPDAVRVPGIDDGTLWPMLLNLEIGTRIKINKSVKAANGGAGFRMSADYYLEAIGPGSIDLENGTWKYTLLLSPAPSIAQPWILQDSTWGQLDVTTVLGF